MTDSGEHLGDQLQEFLDGRLDSAARRAVEAHIAACRPCRRELEMLRWVKEGVTSARQQHDVPGALRARIGAVLDEVDRGARTGRWRPGPRRWALTAGLLAAAAILMIVLGRSTAPTVPAEVAAHFAQVRAGAIALDTATGDVAALEAFFRRVGIRFPTRVFDFGMMGYELAGGRVHSVAGRQSALFAYRAAEGRRVICQMYEGRLDELPAAAESVEHDGITFRVYREGSLTLVFWQEGGVVCVLASDGGAEEAIALARAKAVKV